MYVVFEIIFLGRQDVCMYVSICMYTSRYCMYNMYSTYVSMHSKKVLYVCSI